MKTHLLAIKKRIADYEEKYHRPLHSVKLLAASKGQSAEKILSAYHEGQLAFGENYLQEALKKMESLPVDIEWHFIGQIQSNKTRKIAEHFQWVQSINNQNIAERLNDYRPNHLPPLNICLEVNVSHEINKSGASPDAILALAKYCLTLPRLKLRGLMCIPEQQDNFDFQRQSFRLLHHLYQQLISENILLDTLSMGMSNDFEAAIAEGSTLVRIGTAIFGQRL